MSNHIASIAEVANDFEYNTEELRDRPIANHTRVCSLRYWLAPETNPLPTILECVH